jgi:hypothetical protein
MLQTSVTLIEVAATRLQLRRLAAYVTLSLPRAQRHPHPQPEEPEASAGSA